MQNPNPLHRPNLPSLFNVLALSGNMLSSALPGCQLCQDSRKADKPPQEVGRGRGGWNWGGERAKLGGRLWEWRIRR